MASPGVASPGAASSGVASPGVASPGAVLPGAARGAPPRAVSRSGPRRWRLGAVRPLSRIRSGRPARLAFRILIAAAVGAAAVAVDGFQPATPALITGAVTWLLLTARHDLAPLP